MNVEVYLNNKDAGILLLSFLTTRAWPRPGVDKMASDSCSFLLSQLWSPITFQAFFTSVSWNIVDILGFKPLAVQNRDAHGSQTMICVSVWQPSCCLNPSHKIAMSFHTNCTVLIPDRRIRLSDQKRCFGKKKKHTEDLIKIPISQMKPQDTCPS